ncbi:hypothetical protein NESM_000202700 [Novymonas esmeraldas]|uniref:ribonuclease P n=1 Tax=Novymonas esmeraldas TaxID=1808958 RepID=A0AAW0F9Z3_9TRYP
MRSRSVLQSTVGWAGCNTADAVARAVRLCRGQLLPAVVAQRMCLHTAPVHPAAVAGAPRKKAKRILSPEDALARRVNTLVGGRNAAAAVQVVRDALQGTWVPPEAGASADSRSSAPVSSAPAAAAPPPRCTFSTKAFAAALFACEAVGDAAAGLSLVEDVRQRASGSGASEWLDTEHVLSVVLRLQCMAGDREAATRMFAYLERRGLLRLRSASAFLRFCCGALADRRLAFAVYEAALQHKIELTEPDYVALGLLCVRVREPIGTLFFVLQEMQEHVAVVSERMVREVLEPWVKIANNDDGGAVGVSPRGSRTSMTLQRVEHMQHIPRPSPSPPSPTPPPSAGVAVSSTASHVQGVCPACCSELAGYPFTTACRAHLLRELTELVIPRACRHRRALLGFEHWKRYMQARLDAHDRVDVFIDGANLGYYGLSSWYADAKRQLLLHRGVPESRITARDVDFDAQCKASGRGVDVGVHFELIDSAVRLATDTYGLRRPLVMLHERHVEPQFMTPRSSAVVQRWRERGWLYCSPTGLNDDLCWLYGALLLTDPTDATASGVGAAAHRTFVCTNDKMRDHLFRLLSPRAFTRWRDRHRIAFRCSRVADHTELHWTLPPPYERCIQRCDAAGGLATASPPPLHSAGAATVSAWHIPYAATPACPASAAPHTPATDHVDEANDGGAAGGDELDAETPADTPSEVDAGDDEPVSAAAPTGPWVCLTVHTAAGG